MKKKWAVTKPYIEFIFFETNFVKQNGPNNVGSQLTKMESTLDWGVKDSFLYGALQATSLWKCAVTVKMTEPSVHDQL